MASLPKCVKPAVDLLVTIALWSYYLLCYLLLFGPLYLLGFILPGRERAFQKLNSLMYRSFFAFMEAIVPGLRISIDPAIRGISSSIVIANHLSFLDSILLVSLFARHTTIVKHKFFKIPIFGWVLRSAGYIAPSESGIFTGSMSEQIDRLKRHFSEGGNLFVFPEGTRSRTGALGPFEKGAFGIARLCKVPIRVLRISNTGKLFPPDRFLFQTCLPNEISVRFAGSLEIDSVSGAVPVSVLMRQAAELLLHESQGCSMPAAVRQ